MLANGQACQPARADDPEQPFRSMSAGRAAILPRRLTQAPGERSTLSSIGGAERGRSTDRRGTTHSLGQKWTGHADEIGAARTSISDAQSPTLTGQRAAATSARDGVAGGRRPRHRRCGRRSVLDHQRVGCEPLDGFDALQTRLLGLVRLTRDHNAAVARKEHEMRLATSALLNDELAATRDTTSL